MRARVLLAGVLLLALALRLYQLDFGLPSLNDPDEPVFVMTALDMLREGRLNPGWFGHPATLLFYLLALIASGVAAVGLAAGSWTDTSGFAQAVFADPGTVVLPMRVMSALLGTLGVWLTWRLGRSVAGPRAGLIAALLLAVCALHVDYSQVVRTDMLATVLMTGSLLHALRIARGGRARDHLLAGAAAGLACATKWPAVLVLVAPAAATLWRLHDDRRAWRWLPVAPLLAAVTLVVVSPYLLLDWPVVLRDLGGEARPVHLGATGFGLVGNLGWYLGHPLRESFGIAGLALLTIGCAAVWRQRAAAVVLLPTAAVLLLALAAQALVWARWMVPLLPIAAVLVALGIETVARGHRIAVPAVALLLAGTMGREALAHIAARTHDPRQAASAWVLANVPPGRTLLVEHAAFDLLRYPGRLLFPMGSAGCIDVRAALRRAPSHATVNRARTGRAIVDLGHVDADKLASCRADFAILANADRYRAEAVRFPAQTSIYRRYLSTYHRVARFGPTGQQVELWSRH